jgi:hypothetical protein
MAEVEFCKSSPQRWSSLVGEAAVGVTAKQNVTQLRQHLKISIINQYYSSEKKELAVNRNKTVHLIKYLFI